nr:copia protein [Tanacetum cinerariifolium]
MMTKKFEMSMIGELSYFLGLQINQDDKGISICQEKYKRDLLKKYDISDSSSVKTPTIPPYNLGPDLAGTPSLGLWYPKCLGFDLKGYSDSDHVGCNMDRKSISAVGTDLATAAGTDLERAAGTDLERTAGTDSGLSGKLIHNSILNGPYVRRMIPEPGDANHDVNVTETFHEQTDDELSEKELKQIEA